MKSSGRCAAARVAAAWLIVGPALSGSGQILQKLSMLHSYRSDQVVLSGLVPDTEYRYRVRSGAALSPEFPFRTAPGAPNQWFDPLAAVNDPEQQRPVLVARGNHDGQSSLAHAYHWLPENGSWYAQTIGRIRFVFLDSETHQVDLVVSGYAHAYERGERNGVVYTAVGGAGGALDTFVPPQTWDFIEVALGVHHYVIVDVAAGHLQWTACRGRGFGRSI